MPRSPLPSIRPAAEADLQRLVQVEVSAGQLFRDAGLVEVAEHEPDAVELLQAISGGRAWVIGAGKDAVDVVAGYVIAEVLDGNAHIAQVSVDPRHAGRGLGRALIEHAEAWGRRAGRAATTLTTFRHLAWNAPYYLRLGYRALGEAEIGPELERVMAHEASFPGMQLAVRCAMVKPNV